VKRAFARATREHPPDAPVLIAEGDLQVIDRLAVALEAEMARFDDAGVHGTDGHLVNLLAGDLEEVRHAARRGARLPAPHVRPVAPGAFEPHRLQPGMPLRGDAPLLGDLPLEQVRLRACRRQGRVRVPDVGGNDRQQARVLPREKGHQAHGIAGRIAEERREASAVLNVLHDILAELVRRQQGTSPGAHCAVRE